MHDSGETGGEEGEVEEGDEEEEGEEGDGFLAIASIIKATLERHSSLRKGGSAIMKSNTTLAVSGKSTGLL